MREGRSPGCVTRRDAGRDQIEPRFAAARLWTPAAKRYKKVKNATAMIWKTRPIAGRTFRRLDGSELLAEVVEGVTDISGARRRARRVAT